MEGEGLSDGSILIDFIFLPIAAVRVGWKIGKAVAKLTPKDIENILDVAKRVRDSSSKSIAQITDDMLDILRDDLGDINIGLTIKDLSQYAGKSSKPVENMKTFFQGSFGSILKKSSSGTSQIYKKQRVFEISNKMKEYKYLRKGDKFYLDSLHKNHIEVFDKNGKARLVLNLDGTINIEKTAQVKGRIIDK